jgi:hypothetical protein
MRSIRNPGGNRRVATTIFGADDRRAFRDPSYPWSTVGLVQTDRGSGSGTMIGPRHLLTVSHVIDWAAPPGYAADWVRFTPSFYDGGAPFGEAYGIHICWYLKEDGDGFISGDEGNFDYVVVVLDRRLGDTTGWMGARGYDDDWDDLAVWSHIWATRRTLTAASDLPGREDSGSTAPMLPRSRSCTRPTCSPGSPAVPCSASGRATRGRAPSPFSRGRTSRTTAQAAAWTCATWWRAPGPTSPEALRYDSLAARWVGPRRCPRSDHFPGPLTTKELEMS